MHPTPRILPLAIIKHTPIKLHNLPQHHRHQRAPRLPEPLPLPINIRRAHDRDIDAIPVLRRGRVQDLLRVAVERFVGQRADLVEIVHVGPDFGVELA